MHLAATPGSIHRLLLQPRLHAYRRRRDPVLRRVYAPDGADTIDARIPSRTFSETYGGCAPEYRDAEVRAYQLDSLEPGAGFFVMFN